MNHPPFHKKTAAHLLFLAKGFSLLELAVVIAAVSVLMTMGLGLMRAKQESAAWSETKLKQEKIKIAIGNFLRNNGRLPCPNNVTPWDGAEDTPCLAALGRGVLPWLALGLGRGDVQDGWGNFISYRVANRTPVTASNWTIIAGATAFTLEELKAPLPAITVQERSLAGALGTITNNAVVVLISHGKNGLGARTVGGTLNVAPVGTDELANATPTSVSFVTRTPTEVVGATGFFDDIVAYMTPQDLLQSLVDDKTLRGRSRDNYADLAMQQVALSSCTPPLVAPTFLAIQPNIGNGLITYTCPVNVAYSCSTATAVSNVGTAPGKQLYQLSVFGTPYIVTYGNLVSALPTIASRCP